MGSRDAKQCMGFVAGDNVLSPSGRPAKLIRLRDGGERFDAEYTDIRPDGQSSHRTILDPKYIRHTEPVDG